MQPTRIKNSATPGIQIEIPNGLYQADFTSLRSPDQRQWASLLQHEIIPVAEMPPFTLLRFRLGEYGERRLNDGSISSGGLQQEMARFDRAIASRYPVKVVVIHHHPGGGTPQTLKEPSWAGSIEIHPFDLQKTLSDAERASVRQIIKQARPDVAHFHHPQSALELELLQSLPSSVPAVVSLHGAPVNNPPQPAQSLLFPRIHRSFGRFVFWAQTYRDAYPLPKAALLLLKKTCRYLMRMGARLPEHQEEQIYRIAEGRGQGPYARSCFSAVSENGKTLFANRDAIVVHPPVDSDFFNPTKVSLQRRDEIRRELGISPSQKILLYHARVSLAKGQHLLPEIAAKLRGKTVEPFVMLLVGPEYDRDCAALLKANCNKFGVTDLVRTLPGRDAHGIRELLSIASVGLFPTLDEGLGLTAVECQLMHVPVVAHRVGGVPEVVSDHETGRLVKVGDCDGFASAIADILHAPDRREAMGREGRTRMTENFDHSDLARRVMEHLYVPAVLNSGTAHRADTLATNRIST